MEEVSGDTWARDFYPRSPCGERPTYLILRAKLRPISIHALLAESDKTTRQIKRICRAFLSTLSLRRATQLPTPEPPRVIRFLSTLSLRRATSAKSTPEDANRYFYPRSPCGERQRANSFPHAPPQISIHALLAESDSL